MKLSERTVLITGGASGIGLAMAAELLARGNVVVVAGRSAGKLAQAKAQHPGLHTRACDVTREAARRELIDGVARDFPGFDVLINNAGVMGNWVLTDGEDDPDAAAAAIESEVATNLTAPMRLSALALPHLRARPAAAIVNVTSGIAFAPVADAPVYSATKAALHSFTKSLRHQLAGTPVRVYELAPPTVESDMSAGRFENARGLSRTARAMSQPDFVRAAMRGLARDVPEIRVGASQLIYLMTRVAPSLLDRQMLGVSTRRAAATTSPPT